MCTSSGCHFFSGLFSVGNNVKSISRNVVYYAVLLSFFFCSLKLLRHPSIQDGGQQQVKCPVPQNPTKRASYALFQIFLIVLLNQSD